jgi:hypothetical protein
MHLLTYNPFYKAFQMSSVVAKLLIILVILAALGPVPPLTAGEPKLPLPYGLYVPEGVECPRPGEMPDPAVSCYHNNEGLSLPRRRCKIIKVRNEGNVYYLTQRCLCRGEDLLTLNFRVIIKSRTSFSVLNTEWEQKRTGNQETVYHYCGNPQNL